MEKYRINRLKVLIFYKGGGSELFDNDPMSYYYWGYYTPITITVTTPFRIWAFMNNESNYNLYDASLIFRNTSTYCNKYCFWRKWS